jgi:O-antigen/teichoic acid export membrane protein
MGTARKGIAVLADQAVVSGTNFLTGVIIGRACTKEQFGLFMLGFSIVVFVMSLQTSLILMPYMVYSPRLKSGEHARYTGSTLIHQLGLSALAIVALAVGGMVLSLGIGPQGLAQVVWTFVVVITFILLREYIRQISFANLCFRTALVLDSGVSLVQICGLLLLAYLGLVSASMAYWVIGLACSLAAVGWLVWMRKTFALQLTRAISDLVQNLKFGKWIFASGLLGFLSNALYPWILTAFHGIASNGVWAACFGIAAIANPLLLAMQSFLGPKMAHSYAKGGGMGLRRFVFKACAVSLLLMTPFCLLLIVFGGSLVVMLYGDKYAGNGLVVSVLAITFLFLNVAFSFSRALLSMECAHMDFAVNLVALFVLLTLGLWLVKSFGPLGVACSILAGNIASSVVGYILFSRLTRPVSIQGNKLS